MKVYKIVLRSPCNQLVSLCKTFLPPDDAVAYKPGQWVSARVGLLFAFKNRPPPAPAGSTLVPAGYTREVWLAEVVVSKQPRPKRILSLRALAAGNVEAFWRAYARRWATSLAADLMPYGTLLCDKIKLIKRLEAKSEN